MFLSYFYWGPKSDQLIFSLIYAWTPEVCTCERSRESEANLPLPGACTGALANSEGCRTILSHSLSLSPRRLKYKDNAYLFVGIRTLCGQKFPNGTCFGLF